MPLINRWRSNELRSNYVKKAYTLHLDFNKYGSKDLGRLHHKKKTDIFTSKEVKNTSSVFIFLPRKDER